MTPREKYTEKHQDKRRNFGRHGAWITREKDFPDQRRREKELASWLAGTFHTHAFVMMPKWRFVSQHMLLCYLYIQLARIPRTTSMYVQGTTKRVVRCQCFPPGRASSLSLSLLLSWAYSLSNLSLLVRAEDASCKERGVFAPRALYEVSDMNYWTFLPSITVAVRVYIV